MILLNAEGDCQARTRRLVERLKPSFADHHIMKYKAALQGACKRAGCVLENQAPTLHPPATGGDRRSEPPFTPPEALCRHFVLSDDSYSFCTMTEQGRHET